jgi:hypothetical protein
MTNAYSYVDGVIYRLKYWLQTHGDSGKDEVNTIAFAHVLNMDFDEAKRFTYTGVEIVEGKLRVLFAAGNLGTNVDDSLQTIEKALNEAPQPAGADGAAPKLSSAARLGIKLKWDGEIDAVTKKFADMFQKPDFKLNPRFEENYAKLKENEKSASLDEDWDSRMGEYFRKYFEGAEYQLKYQKFGEDEMLQEGFNEAIEKGEIAIRVVDKLTQGSYNESIIEDGVLYLQVCSIFIPVPTVPSSKRLSIMKKTDSSSESSAHRRHD